MPIVSNGTTIEAVTANGTSMTEVYSNGVLVWTAEYLTGGARVGIHINFSGEATATHSFEDDGSTQQTNGAGTLVIGPDWLTPNRAGAAYDYEIYHSNVVTTGASSSNPPSTGSWQPIWYGVTTSVSRDTVGVATMTFDYQIRSTDNESNIVSGSVELTATYDSI